MLDNLGFVGKVILDAAQRPGAAGKGKKSVKTKGAGLIWDDSPKSIAGIFIASPRHPRDHEDKTTRIIASLTDEIYPMQMLVTT